MINLSLQCGKVPFQIIFKHYYIILKVNLVTFIYIICIMSTDVPLKEKQLVPIQPNTFILKDNVVCQKSKELKPILYVHNTLIYRMFTLILISFKLK